MILKYTADKTDDGAKILHLLKNRFFCTGTMIRRLKSNNTIYLNGTPTHSNVPVKTGDIVSIAILEHKKNDGIIPQDIPIKVIYEDEFIIALDKQPGIAVHPVGKYKDGTLANALRHYFLEKNIDMTVRPIGRLDRNTSGVILFAKNSHVMSRMIAAIKSPDALKIYIGLVHGSPRVDSGIIDLPIKRSETSIIARIASEDGKPSATKYKVLERYGNASLVEFILLTGRTHQIRLHSREMGFPIVGDGIYGDDSSTMQIIGRHALHCSSVSFTHPFTNEFITINSPLPADIENAIEFYKNSSVSK